MDLRTRGPSSQPSSPVDLRNPAISPYVINIVPDDTYAEPMLYQSGYMSHGSNMSVYQSTSPNDKQDSRVSLYQSTPDISLAGSLPQLSDVSVYQSTSPVPHDSGYHSDQSCSSILGQSNPMIVSSCGPSRKSKSGSHMKTRIYKKLNATAIQLLEAWYCDNYCGNPTDSVVELIADLGRNHATTSPQMDRRSTTTCKKHFHQ